MNEQTGSQTSRNGTEEYVTVMVAGQLFGLPISRVQDVFMLKDLTVVPLTAPEIAGVLNLRGRIITAIDMRQRLGLPERKDSDTAMAVGIDVEKESFGLVIDRIGDVLHLDNKEFDANPVNLDPRWKSVAAGVFTLENELLVILDVDGVLDLGDKKAAA